MKIDLDRFVPRAALFAVINAAVIGLLFAVAHPKMPDYNIVYGTIGSILFGLVFEFYMADKNFRRPDISGGWGAAIFGSIAAAAVIFVALLIAKVIV